MKNKVLILVVTVVFMCMSVGSVYAVERVKNPCAADYEKFCSNIPNSEENLDEVLKCFKKNKKELSPECKAYVDQVDSMIKAAIKARKKAAK